MIIIQLFWNLRTKAMNFVMLIALEGVTGCMRHLLFAKNNNTTTLCGGKADGWGAMSPFSEEQLCCNTASLPRPSGTPLIEGELRVSSPLIPNHADR